MNQVTYKGDQYNLAGDKIYKNNRFFTYLPNSLVGRVFNWIKDHQDMEGKIDAQELMEFLDSLR